MTELETKLLTYNKLYRIGRPVVSDKEYDDLFASLPPDSVLLKSGVIDEVPSERKSPLPIPMFSMDKLKTIKELREQAGLKQRELAYQLGIGEGFLSKVENDQKPLKREDLTKLNELFKTPIEELESLWLANKVYSIVRDEETALSALKVAEEQITYNTLRNGK